METIIEPFPRMIRAHTVLLLCLAFTVLGGALLFMHFRDIPPSTMEESVVVFASVDAMLAVHKPTPPLLTSTDAAHYAIHVPGVVAPLEAAQSTADYTAWSVHVQRRHGGQGWEVKIRSRGKIPSFSCRLAFTRDGGLIANRQELIECDYAK